MSIKGIQHSIKQHINTAALKTQLFQKNYMLGYLSSAQRSNSAPEVVLCHSEVCYQDELKTACGNICDSRRQRYGCRGNQNN